MREVVREAVREVLAELQRRKRESYTSKYHRAKYHSVTLYKETYKLLKEVCREGPAECVHKIVLFYINNKDKIKEA